MKMKYALLILGMTILAAISAVGYITRPKIGYMRSYDVYQNSKLSQHYNQQIQMISNSRKMALDSMEYTLQDLEAKLLQNKENMELMKAYNSLGENYLRNKKGYDEQIKNLTMQFEEKIWKAINEYTASYGSKQGYDFIYGANGDGALMYADQGHDVTEDLIHDMNEEFVNPEP